MLCWGDYEFEINGINKFRMPFHLFPVTKVKATDWLIDFLLIVPDCCDVEDCHAETERLPSDHQHRGSSLETAQTLPCTGVHRRRGIPIGLMFTLLRHLHRKFVRGNYSQFSLFEPLSWEFATHTYHVIVFDVKNCSCSHKYWVSTMLDLFFCPKENFVHNFIVAPNVLLVASRSSCIWPVKSTHSKLHLLLTQ